MKYLIYFMLMISSPIYAEIEKLAIPGESSIQLYWWPVLPEVEGWHHDREHSLLYNANAQAPDGFNFADAETVIYVKSVHKPRVPELKTLADFIESDLNKFRVKEDVTISRGVNLETNDEKSLVTYLFSPKEKGNWEQVAYGEEGEYYLIFTISSRNKKSYKAALEYYEQYVSGYRE